MVGLLLLSMYNVGCVDLQYKTTSTPGNNLELRMTVVYDRKMS